MLILYINVLNALGEEQIMSAQGAKKRMGSRRQLKHKSPDVDELQFKETTVQECGGSTESAEDVLELSKNRKKLGSRRNNRQHHAKDLGVSDGAARNTTEDDQLGTTRMSLTDEVKVTHQVPEESHRHAELKRQRYERDQNNETFMNIESEDTEMSCAAEIRTDLAPGEEVEFSCFQVEGAVQTFDLTEMCDKELNVKPVETQDNPRNERLQEVTQPVSQSNLEHREAEASSAGTEETLGPTHLFVATGTVEKESELMCEDEFVLCEAPEGLLSGSPSQDQNPKPRHPEPDPQPLIPKNETPPEDLDDREADSRVELCDNSEEDYGGLDKPGPEAKGFSSSENVAKVNTEDQIESAEMHNIRVSPESVSCDTEPGSSPHQQHVHPATTDQSEASDTGNKESDAVDQVCEVDDQIEDDVKSSSDQLHQEHKDLLSEMEQSCSSQALHSETDSCSDPQPQTSDLNVSLLGNRRKLGSSRRQKGRQRAVDPEPGSYKLPEAAITNSSDEETVETRKISLTLETEVRGGVDENPGDGAFAFLAAEQQKDQSESTEASQEVPDRSSNTRNKTDEDAETLRKEGSYFLSESHMKWKETKCSGAAEITSESQTDAERSTEETQLGDTDRGCLHTFDVTEVDGEKETMTREKHERENSNEALQPDAGCCLSSEAQDGFIKNDEESDTNMKPVETEDNPRNEGLQEVTQPVSQSNLEHREAEASSAGTEEALEPTHLFVATGTVEKESELMCEDEFVLCEAPEGLLSGSPSQDQNPKPRHPEPDPRPLIPKNETPPEDLDDREADTDDQDEAMTLKQEMEEMSSNDCILPFVPQPEAGITLDSDLQEDVATAEDLVLNPIGNRRKLASSRRHKGRHHVKDTWEETFNEPKEETIETTTDEVVVELITASATMRTTASYKFQPETEPDLHPAQNPGVREDKSFQEDLCQNVKDNDQTVTGSDSDIQRMTFQENSAGALVTLEGFTQEAPHLVQKDEDSIRNVHVRHTNDPKDTGGHPGGEESADGQQELVQSSDTSTQQDPEISSSSEPTNAKDTSSDPSLLCFQETISDDPAMEASAGHEPKSHLDDRLHSQEKSKQTRRKMGSTRWTHKKQEDEHVHRAETSELGDNTQAGPGRFEVSLDKNTVSSVELPQEEADITSDLQRTHSNLISHTDGLTACVAGQSASDSQGVFNPTINVQGANLWDRDGNIDVNVEPSQLDGFTAPEAHTAGCLVNPSQRSPIGDAINTRSFESNLVGEESVNSITEIQQPETITSEVGGRAEDPGKVAEGGCIKHLEPADTGSDLNTAGRRRKMGSMRRNLNSGRKEEDVRQQQKVDNEQADEVSEDSVSEHSQEAAKDPRPLEPAPHPTSEEDPADQSAHQPVTSEDSDLMSGTLLSGRRRKLGSHRMSSRPPNQEAQTGGDDKLSEVDDNEKESSTNISSSTPGRHSNPVSDLGSAPRTPVESPPGRRLSQDSRSSISLAGSSGDGGVNSNSYNVVMVGNSSVGKTSFMRRVQNGRFSSDLPSSVGLDTCPWPVTADGRRVVLQLWDTAGQERFHSITRQIFHKAHAFLLMYDITSSWSFTAVSYWANCIQEEAAENVTILLLGNKSDCAERQVATQKGEILAKEYNFEFMECSVATGQNVNESLQTLARILSNKVKLGEETTVLHKEPQQKKSSGCC